MSGTTYVVPLGSWYDPSSLGLDTASKDRCQKAIDIAATLENEGVPVVIATAPGYPKWCQASASLAYAMKKWMNARTNVEILFNHKDNVWGTVSEVQWVLNKFSFQEEDKQNSFVFVSSLRHIIRIRFIAWWFYPDAIVAVCASGGPPTPLLYEMIAWSKLLFYRLPFHRY